ncbi:hypothetical protein CROQUDRAFT_103051 [Cronartium quercuum f. sp. fusiforme G11]|uniref:Uncharacterized protein n=1 Tax=Cronartium quercuum f. sp. fusiforme G11 TaxID=708437 RepID=A0A9P6TIB5_9BASI|nr:hypothetical protein CROQUDRAFT_103051 [Cronartium quercuum f. sp. fusiforme G11]
MKSVLALTAILGLCAHVQGAITNDALRTRSIGNDFSNPTEVSEALWKRDESIERRNEPPPAAGAAEPVDPIENTPAGKKARELYNMMLDMGATLENITSLGAKEAEIVTGLDKVLKFLPQGETLRQEMLAGVDMKIPEVDSALKKATEATQFMISALTEIQKAPSDVILLKKHYEKLESSYRDLFTTSDGLAAEAFKKVELPKKEDAPASAPAPTPAPAGETGAAASAKATTPAVTADAGASVKVQPPPATDALVADATKDVVLPGSAGPEAVPQSNGAAAPVEAAQAVPAPTTA